MFYSKNSYNFKFFYKLLAIFLILGNLIFSITFIFINCLNTKGNGHIIGYYDNNPLYTHDLLDAIITYFFYFTIESNILVLIWFIFSIFFPKYEGQRKYFFLSPITTLFLTIYILNTMIIFLTILLPSDYNKLTKLDWLKTMIFHVVSPLMFIFYVFFFYKFEPFNQKTKSLIKSKIFFKDHFWKIYFFPVFYLIINFIRSIIRLNYHSLIETRNDFYYVKYHSAFLYPFLDWRKKLFNIPGLYTAMMIIAIFVISSVVLILFYKIFQFKQLKYNLK